MIWIARQILPKSSILGRTYVARAEKYFGANAQLDRRSGYGYACADRFAIGIPQSFDHCDVQNAHLRAASARCCNRRTFLFYKAIQ